MQTQHQKVLSGLATQVDDITKKYNEFKESLKKVQNALPANEKVLRTEIDKIIGKIDQSIIQQKEIRTKLKNASDDITLASGTTTLYRKDLKKQIKQSAKDISSIQDSYEKKVQTNLTKLVNSLTVNNGSVSKVVNNLNQGTSDVSKLAGDSGAQLGQLKKILKNSGKALGKASKNVSNISFKLGNSENSDATELLKNILSNSPDTLSSFLSSPVKMNTNVIYKVDNYGSAMAPFYSTLSNMVGGIVLVAMMKVTLEEDTKETTITM